MFVTALVALDLSPAERPIIDCLPALAAWGVRRVVLCHAVRVGYAQGGDLAKAQDYSDWLEKCAAPLRTAGMEVAIEIRSGGVIEDEILAAAAQAHAELIVVGSRGHNVVARMFLGSVARALLHKATTSVLLEWVEPTAAATQSHCEAVCTDTLRHVVVATDFSVDAAAAEHAVIRLAAQTQRIDALHVAPGADSTVWQLSPQATQAALAGLAARIHEAGGTGRAVILDGVASQEIARYATTHDVSLIVVGKHGRGRLSDKLIGSTAARVCEIAGRPVLMVP
jgi:nucleotide-binding universal stress UspA family protein